MSAFRKSVFLHSAAGGAAALLLILLSACTDYERAGVNPRPFNEPSYWEINPYGRDAFQN